MSDNIDINLYDRQVRTYGLDAIKKMSSSSVLIYGLKGGLGTEVGKNLSLGGIKNIYLYDKNNVIETDLETGIYYNTSHVNKDKRSDVLVNKLQELNPYVLIKSVESYEQNQQVTIIINQSIEMVIKVNEYCRFNNSKLVVLYSKGYCGSIFVDAGNNHIVTDITSENIEPVQIGEISLDGKVKCAQYNAHNFQSGDTINFTNLQGSNIEQFEKEWKIKVLTKTVFQLQDFDKIKNPFIFVNGTANYIKKSVTINHKTFKEQINNPTFSFNFDMDDANNLVKTFVQLFENNKKLYNDIPFIWSNDNDNFITKNNIKSKHVKLFKYELIPVVSFMGSFAASEVIKLITNKYLPIDQWFTWSDNNLLPQNIPKDYHNAKTTMGLLYGKEFEDKLINSKWLLVGSGAIGCEHLKNLAFLNVANKKYGGNGEIIITDPDTIEKSNLNRQFLFRNHHIGKSKSEIAMKSIQEFKPLMNISAHLQTVSYDNNFTDTIMSGKITGVLNALDNIKARRFMDEQCFKYGLPLFESGTTGTKGNTQPVIPFITETYSSTTDHDIDKSFPLCTIKSYPNEIQHTIHWAMDQFQFFNRAPTTIKKYLEKNDYIDSLSMIEKNIAINDINSFVDMFNDINYISKFAFWAVNMFTENYYNNIVQLLYTFKPDHEISPGVLFWSGGKRCPKPINFDINNNLHLDYVETTIKLLLISCGLNCFPERKEIYKILESYKPNIYNPVEMKIASNDSELEKVENNLKDTKLKDTSVLLSKLFMAQEFEKDDDMNSHVKWINIVSNMRALNYSIPIVDFQETKGIAGRIIPAISTTTSAVSGLIMLEMIKYLLGLNKEDNYRSTFINLAESLLIHTEPVKASMININGVEINNWTKFIYTEDSILDKFKSYYEDIFKTKINMIVIGSSLIYSDFMNSENLERKLSELILETFENEIISDNISFNMVSEDESKILPNIIVKLIK